MLTHNIHVKMGAYGIQPSIHAVEGETGRFVNIYTDDRAVTSSLEAELSFHRPDDSYYSTPEVVVIPDSTDGPGYYHLSLVQALTRPGKVECQLKISSNGLVLSTYTFYIVVEPSVDGIPVAQLGYDIYDLIEAAETITPSPGLTDDIKQALLDCFEHVAWTDEHGQDYVDALEAALYPPANLLSISAVYTQSGAVYDTASLDDLKPDLVVTAHYDDGTSETVTNYTLSGTLAVGTSTVTVSYGGKTTTFDVAVTEYPSYSITYNLTNVTSSNNATKVAQGGSYTTTISYDSTLYSLALTVTMGGVDITSTAYGDGTILINEVTGNVVITATATLIPTNEAVIRKAGSSLYYLDSNGDAITYKPYGVYGMVLDVASANSTATVTIINNGSSTVGAGLAIYAGETDKYTNTGRVNMYNASVAFTVPSVGIAVGGSVTFTASVRKGYRLLFTVPSEDCSVVVKGIANDAITYTKTYTTAISSAAQPAYYYDTGDTSGTQNRVNYARNRITTEAFAENTVVTIIFEQKTDVSTGDINANRWFACAESATGGSNFFYAEHLSTDGALPNLVYARFVYTVRAGFHLAIQSALETSLSDTYTVTVVEGDVR